MFRLRRADVGRMGRGSSRGRRGVAAIAAGLAVAGRLTLTATDGARRATDALTLTVRR